MSPTESGHSNELRQLIEATQAETEAKLKVKQTLETVLDSNEKRLVYHLTDGQRSVAEIQKLTGVNVRYISEWGQEWERIGIAGPSRVSSVRGRRQRAFDLADFGLEIPGVSS